MQVEKKIQIPDTTPIAQEPQALVTYLKDLGEVLVRYTAKLADLLNKGIRITDNIDGVIQTITFNVANNEYEISHALKRIPNGFIILNKNKASDVYDSGTTWTTTSIYLKCDTAGAVIKLIVL